MKNTFYIAWKYIVYHKIKTLTLISCITITLLLPLSLELILNASEKQLLDRAENSPILVGANGSALDLSMNALYFSEELTASIRYDNLKTLVAEKMGTAIPLYVKFNARGFPIVGTNVKYFTHRKLNFKEGRNFARIGECVIGSKIAADLQLTTGDYIISSPENIFDLAGVYPLKMKIVGVLNSTNSADDLGVFVDVKTTWIIEGFGHGHQEVKNLKDPTLIASKTDTLVRATAKLKQYNEIDDSNIDSFHFHGDLSKYPISSILIFPTSPKSEALLRGRYIGEDIRFQLVKPKEVINELLQNIFKVRNILDTVIAIVTFATFLAMFLVFSLSLRLRAREIETIFKLGCKKGTITRIMAAEILVIVFFSTILCILFLLAIDFVKQDLISYLLF